ncbi:MAG TPA: RpiB/LacA/LacB family sugar-phosphate isomerase [Candidatus Saccharimonadales bacterium]|nr:RpiB/LacA/LacB family sugar-phosphate isomerase [Candidatus Saccharimonadales bacterium]
MKIFIGADHQGFAYKQQLAVRLQQMGHDVVDSGDETLNPHDDFPQFAGKVCASVLSHEPVCRGILICGSGQGMAMAANRFKGIRASLCWNIDEARSARNDDDSNVLCISAKQLSIKEAESIISVWLTTSFAAAPRFIRRLHELDELG